MHRDLPISATHQMYLKVLYRLSQNHPVGRVRDIARELGVTPGTVSMGLNRLQDLGLVEREHYGGALLTPAGSAVAHCVIRRFETLRALLIEVFGVDPRDAEDDACLMEHDISPVTLNRIAAFLEHLRAGESFDLQSLRRFHGSAESACANCEAAGFCQATELTAQSTGSER